MSKGLSPHAPDDELDERWLAARSHPQLGDVPHFLDVDLAAAALHGDAVSPRANHESSNPSPDVNEMEEIREEDIDVLGGRYDDGSHTRDQEIGHDMLHEEFDQRFHKSRELIEEEFEDFPL